MDMYSSLS